jgi:hypothetical protein
MSNLCACTLPTSLAQGTYSNENVGQYVRLFFQRTRKGTATNGFTVATADPTELASWSALFAKTDSEKIVKSPLIHNVEIAAGEVREYANEGTANGKTLTLGTNQTTISGMFLNESQAGIESLKALMCEVNSGEGLSVFFVTDCGTIDGQTQDAFTTWRGFEVQNFWVGDRGGNTRSNPAMNSFKLQLKEGWSDYSKIIQPADFDAQTI